MDIVFCGLPRAFDGFSAWNHNHGRLQCCRNTDGIAFYFFRKKTWISFAAQLVGLYYLNVVMLGDLYYPVHLLILFVIWQWRIR